RRGAPCRSSAAPDRLAGRERMEVLGRERHPAPGPPGLALLGQSDRDQDVVEGLDVRERVVSRNIAIVAPPDMDGVPRDGAPERLLDERAIDPDDRGASGRGPV